MVLMTIGIKHNRIVSDTFVNTASNTSGRFLFLTEPGGSGSVGPPPGAAWDVDMERSGSGGGSDNWDTG